MKNKKILLIVLIAIAVLISVIGSVYAVQTVVNLGTAGNFVILAKTGVSTTGTTAITGNIGVSPYAATFITGFDLIADSTNTFATSSLVTGKIYAADYTPPTPTVMTTAVSDMETAYTDAAGRTLPDYTELYAGDITGKTLTPGLYKWGTGVLISAGGVTISGGANDIFIFQIAQDLTVANGAIITLSGGAQAKNIFWQVAGKTTLGTTSQFKGIILCQTLIDMQTGAVLNGRALAQTAVTLDANAVSLPAGVAVVVIDTTPIVATSTSTSTSSNSNSGSSSSSSSTNVQVNTNSNGIGQQLTAQIAERRTEYKSGSFTTSLGQFLNVRELASGFRELRESNVIVKTKMNLIKLEGNKSKLEVELGNKSKVELKIMPSTASATALARLKLKVCSEANNCTIELKEVGVGKETKLAYQMKAQKDVKIIGLFRAKMNVEANVDAKTGEIISIKKPWWAGFAVEGEQA